MDFERTPRRTIRALPLTPLIDVMFILIIFFMLTTSFMRIESLELLLPSASAKMPEKNDVLHLFIEPSGDMILGQRKIGQEELTDSLSRMFSKDPATRIMLLTADGVSMQQLVNVMDKVYLAGGRSLFVRKWERAAAQPAPAAVQ